MADAIRVAKQLAENRDIMRSLYNDKWPDKVKEISAQISEGMSANNETNLMQFALRKGQELSRMGKSPMILFAVVCEMIEAGSEKP